MIYFFKKGSNPANIIPPPVPEDPKARKIRLSRLFRKGLNAGYFIGSVIALTNQIKVRGSVKAVSYLQKSQTKKFIEQKKSFLVRVLVYIVNKHSLFYPLI